MVSFDGAPDAALAFTRPRGLPRGCPLKSAAQGDIKFLISRGGGLWGCRSGVGLAGSKHLLGLVLVMNPLQGFLQQFEGFPPKIGPKDRESCPWHNGPCSEAAFARMFRQVPRTEMTRDHLQPIPQTCCMGSCALQGTLIRLVQRET